MTTTLEPLLTPEEAAALITNTTARTVKRLAAAGKIAHHRMGRFYRFKASAVAAYIESIAVVPPRVNGEG